MTKRVLIVLLCCFTAVLLLIAFVGCDAPGLEEVYKELEKMQFVAIEMDICLENNEHKTDIASLYLYGEESNKEDFFLYSKINIDSNTMEIFFDNGLAYHYQNGQFHAVSRMDISENITDTSEMSYYDFLILEFGESNFLMTQKKLPKGRTAYDFDFNKDSINSIFGELVGDFLSFNIRLTVKNRTKLPESMYMEFNIGEKAKITCEATYIFKKQENDKKREELENIIPEEASLSYELSEDGKSYEMSKYNGLYDIVNIPSEYNGLPVSLIGDNAFSNTTTVKIVTMPDTVTSIGRAAFSNDAFLDVQIRIQHINLSKNLNHISEDAFHYCSAEIVFPEDSVIETIGNKAFAYYCGSSIALPESVRIIGDEAFFGSSHEDILLPSKLTYIGDCAFSLCHLESIVIPATVTSLGYAALSGSINLIKIDILSKHLILPESIFDGCYNLAELNSDDGVIDLSSFSIIEQSAFRFCKSITSVILSSDLTTIPDALFSDCMNLISIIIPEGVEKIGAGAFYNCMFLRSITIPSTIVQISSNAFRSCASLETVNLSNGLKVIADEAFNGCLKLVAINLPNSLTTIGDSTFLWCHSLISVTIHENVVSIGLNSFSSCSNLIEISVCENNQYFKSVDGVLFDKAGACLINYPAGKSDSSYIVPENISEICNFAFQGANNLEHLTLPASIKTIGYSALSTWLKSLYLLAEVPPDFFLYHTVTIPIYVPSHLVETYKSAYSCCNILAIPE